MPTQCTLRSSKYYTNTTCPYIGLLVFAPMAPVLCSVYTRAFARSWYSTSGMGGRLPWRKYWHVTATDDPTLFMSTGAYLLCTASATGWRWYLRTVFILVFPTGNAISERGFSAMGASNSKQRSEMSHEQVFAHMIIGFNGPSTSEFATKIRAASKFPNWNLYIHPNNYN